MKTKDVHIDFERSIAPWIGRTSKVVDYYLHDLLNQFGLDMSKEQVITLKMLHDNDGDGLNQNDLAFLTSRDKSSLARLLSKMEKKKYILRKQHLEDKRVNQVFLTDEGRSVYKQAKVVLKQLICSMEKDISQTEKKQLVNILKKVQFNLMQEKVGL
ncbi:MAG: MarR family transcriptional regulator [Maribacter sp.]|uniref:MarR family winged helix-turn-helix transcriptional regulator n=1 Tax=Maribacter sp. TaxID=1897614 RepID=UPI003C7389DC